MYLHKARTKIIATIGPSCDDPAVLKQLFLNGVTATRLNFSHSSQVLHLEQINKIRRLEVETKIPISIMLDTRGPEIRVGKMKNNVQEIKRGKNITIYSTNNEYNNRICGSEELTISDDISQDIRIGASVLIDDGKLLLTVTKTEPGIILARAFNTHLVKTNKRVNLPGTQYTLPFLSKRDKSDILFGIKHDIDYIAASFTNSADNVNQIRQILRDNNAENVQIIAKIESQIGIDNLDEIIAAADGCMFARGDLALEIPYYNLPYYEKLLIRECRNKQKIVIVATQMLESMTDNPTPTRAEVTDVYYATELGADATMLSGETASGQFPVLAVQTMTQINLRAEKEFYSKLYYAEQLQTACQVAPKDKRTVIARSLALKTEDGDYEFAIVLSNTGQLLKRVSQFRPNVNILSVTSNEHIYNSYGVWHSVFSNLVPDMEPYKDGDAKMLSNLARKWGAKPGSKVLFAHNYDLTEFTVLDSST